MNVKYLVHWLASECERQETSPVGVANMYNAWEYACSLQEITPTTIAALGWFVEPTKNNFAVFRRTPVTIGMDLIPWESVERSINLLCEATSTLHPYEFYRAFEEIHPFVDGNGRVGAILYNFLSGTLLMPTPAPDFWKVG